MNPYRENAVDAKTRVLSVSDRDTIVVTSADYMPEDAKRTVADRIKAVTGHDRVLVLDGGVQLTVLDRTG